MAHQRSKRGGRSLHHHPSRAARRRAGRGGDTRGAASLRFVAADAENACCSASGAPFRGSTQTQRREFRPLREKRCGCPKSGPLRWTHPPFISGPPVGRHRRDPQRRESSIIPAPAEATVAFNGGPIASASLTPVAQLRTRRLVALGGLMKKEFPPATLIDKHDRSLDRDQDRALRGLPPRSPADGDCTPPSASAPLEGWRPPLKFLAPGTYPQTATVP